MNFSSALRSAAGVQTAQIKGRIQRQARAAGRALLLALLAALLLVCALVFVMVGAYHSLSETLPHWQAGGLVALGAVAVCLLLLAIAALGRRRTAPRRRAQEAVDPEAQQARALADLLHEHRPTGLDLTIAAFVVGLLASRSGGRRRDHGE